jgi:hypothetical protein
MGLDVADPIAQADHLDLLRRYRHLQILTQLTTANQGKCPAF